MKMKERKGSRIASSTAATPRREFWCPWQARMNTAPRRGTLFAWKFGMKRPPQQEVRPESGSGCRPLPSLGHEGKSAASTEEGKVGAEGTGPSSSSQDRMGVQEV